MNTLTRIMSYDKNKPVNQEKYSCTDCTNLKIENQITESSHLSNGEIEQIIQEKYPDKDEKTKTFIRKALRVHGDKYDYSKTVYIKALEKVEIICKIKGHSSFLQTPNSHLNGNGCRVCANKCKKLTTEEFIIRANKIYGKGIYDYSEIDYVNGKTKVTIICQKHGSFKQTPSNHLRGHGCPKCQYENIANKKRMSLQEFVEKANKIHGKERYNYIKVNYVNNNTKITIICNKHNKPYEFQQTPYSHLSGSGCPLCGYIKISHKNLLSLNEFIKIANEVHGIGTYDYSKVKYINCNTKVTIICPRHGEFKQIPSGHLQGRGCYTCGIEKRANFFKLTKEQFIEKANKIHGIGKYDYSKVKYNGMFTKVKIICHKHGEFTQTPSNHLHGYGCSICGESKGEITIRNFLNKYKIEFEEQKRFIDCRDKNPLPFDFYIPQYNLCIEFDGLQHFRKIKWNKEMSDEKSESNFRYIQYHDKIKNDYCENNNIDLLRIRYDENIEDRLINIFGIEK